MAGIHPAAVIVLALVGGGFLVLVAAAIHRTMTRGADRSMLNRPQAQDSYMREVRQTTLDRLAPAYMKPNMHYNVRYSEPYTDNSSRV